MPKSILNRGIFVDREGVMNVRPPDSEDPHDWYVSSWDQFKWMPDVLEAFEFAYTELSYYDLFTVSNQACIGRFPNDERFSYMNIETVMQHMFVTIDDEVRSRIQAYEPDHDYYGFPLPGPIRGEHPAPDENHVLRDVIMCPHLPDDPCCCRKPKPGMIYFLALRWVINLSKSWMIGDSVSDMKAGWNAGIRKLIHIVPDSEPFDPEKTGLVNLMARKQTRRKWNIASGFPLPDLKTAFVFINEYDATYRGRR